MTSNQTRASDEAEIRQLINHWTTAIQAKNVDAIISHCGPDVLSYDLAPPLLYYGADPYRRNLQEWFSTFDGPVGLDVRDLRITAGNTTAFSTSLNRISGTRTNGEKTDVWVRATLCFVKNNGAWIVTHEHVSVPFRMDGSYKAAIDLKP